MPGEERRSLSPPARAGRGTTAAPQSAKEKVIAMLNKSVDGKSDAELEIMMSRLTQAKNSPQNGIEFGSTSK